MKVFFAVFSFFMIVTAPVFAEETPDISVAGLKKAIAGGNVILLDVNGTKYYAKGHIPGAIDFCKHEENLAAVLPVDKERLIVIYCGGPSCDAYMAGVEAVAKLSYTNVKYFSAGISGWIGAGEKTDDAATKKKS